MQVTGIERNFVIYFPQSLAGTSRAMAKFFAIGYAPYPRSGYGMIIVSGKLEVMIYCGTGVVPRVMVNIADLTRLDQRGKKVEVISYGDASPQYVTLDGNGVAEARRAAMREGLVSRETSWQTVDEALREYKRRWPASYQFGEEGEQRRLNEGKRPRAPKIEPPRRASRRISLEDEDDDDD